MPVPEPSARQAAPAAAPMAASTASPASAPAVAPLIDEGPSSVAIEHDGTLCRIGGTLDFTTAREALERVVPLIESGAIARIDLGDVVRSNSAGLALMVEWLAVAGRAGRELAFDGVPDGLRQLAGVCQVDALLQPR